jgi:hypothetical protein
MNTFLIALISLAFAALAYLMCWLSDVILGDRPTKAKPTSQASGVDSRNGSQNPSLAEQMKLAGRDGASLAAFHPQRCAAEERRGEDARFQTATGEAGPSRIPRHVFAAYRGVRQRTSKPTHDKTLLN